ncbi:MAG: hypothetical protein U0235_00600 [Polyangiaceae bacterium]
MARCSADAVDVLAEGAWRAWTRSGSCTRRGAATGRVENALFAGYSIVGQREVLERRDRRFVAVDGEIAREAPSAPSAELDAGPR